MTRTIAALAVALVLTLPLGGTKQARAGEISIHGSSSFAEYIMLPYREQIEAKSGQKLKIVAHGTGSGVMDLLAGKAHMAMISSPLDAVITRLNQKNPGSVDGSLLVPHQIATTRIAFVAHPSNPVKSLNRKQLVEILAGRLTNWKALGGKDAPIVVMAEKSGGGARSVVEQKLLYGGNVTATARVVGGGATKLVKAVAGEPNAIGISTQAAVDSSVSLIATDQPLEQPLILLTRGAPSDGMAAVISATRGAGYQAGQDLKKRKTS